MDVDDNKKIKNKKNIYIYIYIGLTGWTTHRCMQAHTLRLGIARDLMIRYYHDTLAPIQNVL
jgi:hypothetical protein